VWRRIRLAARLTSRVTATTTAATSTNVHHGEPLCTIVVTGALAGDCGAAGKPLPSFGGAGEAAEAVAAARSPSGGGGGEDRRSNGRCCGDDCSVHALLLSSGAGTDGAVISGFG
jgi:hypothetical protein